jgi:thymidylate synthase (FAD)
MLARQLDRSIVNLIAHAGLISTSPATSWEEHQEYVNKRRPKPEDKVKFLENLERAGHFSVFEHSLIALDITECSLSTLINTGWLKDYYGPVVLGNLRHLLDTSLKDCAKLIKAGTIKSLPLIRENELEVKPFLHYYNSKVYKITFFIFNISRTATHQFVRHKTISFTQQSQRYTDVNKQIKPINTTWGGEIPEEVIEHYKKSLSLYKLLREKGYKKEQARDVLPNIYTNIVATTFINKWEHFVNLRAEKSAQEEIRILANIIKNYIKGVKNG